MKLDILNENIKKVEKAMKFEKKVEKVTQSYRI
jgi:hypothetical protein